MTAAKYASAQDTSDSTNGVDGWHDVSDAGSASFSSKTGCVEATFEAQMDPLSDDHPITRVLLDNAQECEPGEIFFLIPTNPKLYAPMTFMCVNVPSGTHTIQVQFENSILGQGHKDTIDGRTLEIRYKP